MVKKLTKYVITLKKRLVWVVFSIKENRDKDNETELTQGGGIEMSTTVLPLRDARSLFALY